MSIELLSQSYTLTLILALLLPVAGAITVWMRKRRLVYAGVDASGLDRSPQRVIQWTEAALLLLAGTSILAFVLTQPRGGYLINTARLNPDLATRYWTLAILAAMGVLGAFYCALRGQTRLGLLILIGFVGSHGLHINSKKRPYAVKEYQVWEHRGLDTPFTIRFRDQQNGYAALDGADVWIGDHHLGQTPIQTTIGELWAMIGDTPAEPSDYDNESTFRTALFPTARSQRRHHGSHFEDSGMWHPDPWHTCYRRFYGQTVRPWIRVAIPEREPSAAFRRAVPVYMRAKFGDHEVFLVGGDGKPLNGHLNGESVVNVVVPDRQAALEDHLINLRKSHYQASKEWIDHMLTFGQAGEAILDHEAIVEAEFRPIYEQLIAAKLEAHFGPDSSFTDAEVPDIYSSFLDQHLNSNKLLDKHSTESQWLRHLAPRLDPHWLTDQLKPIIRSPRFPDDHDPRWRALGTAAVALDKHLNAKTSAPNLLETELVPWLLSWHATSDYAAHLGGPVYETYITRHVQRDPHRRTRQAYKLTGEVGRETRAALRTQIINDVDFGIKYGGHLPPQLFLDGPFHSDSLARQHYPSFQRLIEQEKPDLAAGFSFQYLVQMEPETPVRLYRETFEKLLPKVHQNNQGLFLQSTRFLKRIAPEKRIQVATALREATGAAASRLDQIQQSGTTLKQNLHQHLDEILALAGDPEAIQRLIQDPNITSASWTAEFLERPRPEPIVNALAISESTFCRQLAQQTAKKYPFQRQD